MVRQGAIDEAAALARERPTLGVGLHVDLSEWVYHDGEWAPLYEVVVADDREAVEAEVAAQLACFSPCSAGSRPISTRTSTGTSKSRSARCSSRPGAGSASRCARLHAGDRLSRRLLRPDRHGAIRCPRRSRSTLSLGLLSSLPNGITELGCHPAAEPGGRVSLRCRASARAGGALRPPCEGGRSGRGDRALLFRWAVRILPVLNTGLDLARGLELG